MKGIKIILGLILFASVTTFAQSPRIKLNQITKDTVKGSVLISSPSDSGMVYSRDFYVAYGADTVLILYGDTLGGVGGGFASVLSDGVTITGDGTTGNELKVDTLLIATIKALNDSLATISASTTPDNVTITGDGSVGNPLKVDTNTVISTIQGLVDSLTNYVTIAGTETITGAKTFTSDLNIDAKIALNAGDNNIVIGDGAGASLVSGQALGNVLIGTNAGAAINSGDYNIANGYEALYNNTTGYSNIANGYVAMYYNTTGFYNVANGHAALYNNTTGVNNIANGGFALYNNTTGVNNIVNGYAALYNNTTGVNNIANGGYALNANITGSYNLANGYAAFYSLSSGSNNQAYGYEAGRYYGSGSSALTTAEGSLFFGNNTRASADGNTNEIVIGTDAIGNGSNSVTIGNDGTIGAATTKTILNGNVGIGTTSPSEKLDVDGNARFRSIGSGASAGALHYTSTGVLTTNTSDARLKTNLQPLENTLNKLLNINTYTFNWINETDRVDLGMIAQEVEQIFPNLVFTNNVDGYKGIHYDKFTSILTKAIQEQQAIIESQQSEIEQLKTLITDLTNRLTILENK